MSSRATLSEAACELFLERGYEATSIADIAQRAGVSRSSFFNYFASKSAVLWSGLDERIERIVRALAETAPAAGVAAIPGILGGALDDLEPDALALAYTNAAAMGLEADLLRESAIRQSELAQAIAAAAAGAGIPALRAEVLGAAWAGAVLAALRAWAEHGAGRGSLRALLDEASQGLDGLV